MTQPSPPLSRQQRFFNKWARYAQRPALDYLRHVPLLRFLTELTAPLTYKRPANMVLVPQTLKHDGAVVPAVNCTIKNQSTKGTLLYLHGGGFVMGNVAMYQHLVAALGAASHLRGVYVDYRLAPEHPFPAAIDDAVTAYQALLADPNSGPIAIAGDSAGGNLVLSLLIRIKTLGLPMPFATAAMSPVVDLHLLQPSFTDNVATDHLLSPAWGSRSIDSYALDHDRTEPTLSPIYGDFTGAPAMMVHYDTNEVLADDGRMIVDHLRNCGVTVATEISTGRTHVWHLNVGRTSEADASVALIGDFIKDRIPA